MKRRKKSFNFKQWCLNNDKIDWILNWDESNTLPPEELSTRESYLATFNTPHGIGQMHRVIATITHQNLDYQEEYDKTFASFLYEKFSEGWVQKWSENNNVSPFDIRKKSNTEILLKCEKHGEWITTPKKFNMQKTECPKCAKEIRGEINHVNKFKTRKKQNTQYMIPNNPLLEDFPHVVNFWSDNNIYSPEEYYTGSNAIVWFKCDNNKHEDYTRRVCEATMSNFACPRCQREQSWSRLQKKVYNYISDNYKILNERDCTFTAKNPLTGYPLPYDNEIVELKLLIEVQGIQHYRDYKDSSQMDSTKGNTRKFRDEAKKKQAIENGYFYLEIPFYAEYKDEWKKLIDDKIHFILSGGVKNF